MQTMTSCRWTWCLKKEVVGDFFDQGDIRLKGMLMEVSESHSKFGQVLEMVGVISIQAAKGTSMVCPQCLVPSYWRGWEFNHEDVFVCIHGI